MDKALRKVKLELLKNLHGRVLDVGCGDGMWLKYFGKADSVTELEPNPFLIEKIRRNVNNFKKDNPSVDVEVVQKFVSDLDVSKPYDFVVFGNVMCEVPDQKSFLRDVDAVLKPGGKIMFQEHIREPSGTFAGKLGPLFSNTLFA
jgi:2-polyprenyl-3-methyl-5-hydroxy-6-metoxy-1,4-benzoquinol methylase